MSANDINAAIEAGTAGRDAMLRLELAAEFTEQTAADLKTSLGMVGDALVQLAASVNDVRNVLSRLAKAGGR